MPVYSHPQSNGLILTRIWSSAPAEAGGQAGFFNSVEPGTPDADPGESTRWEGTCYVFGEFYSRRQDAMDAGSTYIRFLKLELPVTLPQPQQGDRVDVLVPVENTLPPQFETVSFGVAAVEGPDPKRAAALGESVYSITTRED